MHRSRSTPSMPPFMMLRIQHQDLKRVVVLNTANMPGYGHFQVIQFFAISAEKDKG